MSELKKPTDELENELTECESLEQFKTQNADQFIHYNASDYLKEMLTQKNLKKADAVKRSGLSCVYAYQIFSGSKHPERDKLLCIAIGCGLSPEETNHLLRLEGKAPLYPRIPRDAAILFGLKNGYSVETMDDLLYEQNENTLLE